jgi:hypothetical protein
MNEEAYAKVCCLYAVPDLDKERPLASPLLIKNIAFIFI